MFKTKKYKEEINSLKTDKANLIKEVIELRDKLNTSWLGCYTRYAFGQLQYDYLFSAQLLRENYKGIMFVDANNLKEINDTKGHQEGDNYLKSIVDTLKKHFSEIYRLGGDEFIVMVKHEEKIPSNLSKNKTISYGYQTISKSYDTIKEIIEEAEIKMYERKLKNK